MVKSIDMVRFLAGSALCSAFALTAGAGCGGDDDNGGGGNAAVAMGVGAECTNEGDCDQGQKCLAFKGGYCGLEDCSSNLDCPSGSACVAHTDGANYCFLTCTDKAECNVHRPLDAEANCVANVTFVDADPNNHKACVPPEGSSGTGGSGGSGGAGGAPMGSG
jgi:hypothetical protein